MTAQTESTAQTAAETAEMETAQAAQTVALGATGAAQALGALQEQEGPEPDQEPSADGQSGETETPQSAGDRWILEQLTTATEAARATWVQVESPGRQWERTEQAGGGIVLRSGTADKAETAVTRSPGTRTLGAEELSRYFERDARRYQS